MKLTLFTANCTGNKANCSYPNRTEIVDAEMLQEAVAFDHVCAEYKNNYRGNDNFLSSDCLVMDVDNDHSENPTDWINEGIIHDIFSDVDYALVTSRHHLIAKDGKAARPKFHIYFPIAECTSAEEYGDMKVGLHKKYPFFDGNALDAARFLFGAESEIVWNDGWLTVDDLIEKEEKEIEEPAGGPILEGSRNNTMSRFAGRVLKRYGICDKARDAFLEHAKKCEPPLPDDELDTIWASAVRFFHKKVEGQEGYVAPDDYNMEFDGASLKPDDYSDIGEAKVLVREYGDELKYTSATDYLRHDGLRWVENKELALGAVEEFMDLQLADARDELERATEALEGAGVPEEIIKAGGSALAKFVSGEQMGPYYTYLAAQAYMKFVMKYRN